MNLKTYLDSERGRTSSLARAIGAHASDVSAWKAGTRPIPIHFGLPIEQATDGQVTRQEMFPPEVIAKVWPDLNKTRLDSNASGDDAQNPTGGESDRGIKEMRKQSASV